MSWVIGAIAVGLLVGMASGLLGIGGGTIMVPAFRLIFGLSPLEATATSLFTIIPTSLSGAWKHKKNRTCVVKLGLAAGLAGACMSPVGVWAADHVSGWVVMMAASAVIMYSSVNMFRSVCKKDNNCEGTAPESLSEQENSSKDEGGNTFALMYKGKRRNAYLFGALVGLAAGFLGGFVGVGGGFIMIPLFVSVLGLPMSKASGTSLIAVLLIAVPATIEQALLGHIRYGFGLAFAVGSIPGAIIGASLVKHAPERVLKIVFSVFLVCVAIMLVVNELGVMG